MAKPPRYAQHYNFNGVLLSRRLAAGDSWPSVSVYSCSVFEVVVLGMTLRHQLDTLIVYDPDRSTSTVNVWVAHPSPSEEQTLGTLFVVSAIEAAGRINHEVLGLLQEELKRQYYQASDQRMESTFEGALQRTNQRLHELIREGVAAWVDQAHILAGVLWHDRIILTSLGTIHAFLVRRERLHDLLGAPAAGKPNPLRLFDHVVTGQVEADDRLLLCTPSLLDYFSMEKLRRTLLDHTPSQAARLLETTLLCVGPRLAFSELLLQFEAQSMPTVATVPATAYGGVPPTAVVSGVNTRPAPQLSMDQLVARERTTEKIMAPSLWPTIRDLGTNFSRGLQRTFRSAFGRPTKRSVPSVRIPSGPNAPRATASRLVNSSKRGLNAIAQRARAVVSVWPRPTQPVSSMVRAVGQPWLSLTAWLNRIVRWFRGLVPAQRRVVIVFVVLSLVFSTAIVRTTSNGPPSNDSRQIDTRVRAIENSLAQSEAALLFGGDDLAKRHLDEAARRLAELPNRRRSDRERNQRLTRELTTLRDRLRRVTLVPNPEVVVNLAPGFPDVRPAQLYLADNRYVLFDPRSGSVLVGQVGEAADPVASQNTLDTGTPRTGALIGLTRLIFATDRGTFVEFSLSDQTWRPIDSRFPIAGPFIQSLSVFQSRLYALDPSQDQIYRFSLGSTSLGTGQAWLRETVELGQARAAVVDGSIFVLQPDGGVEKYFGGRRTDFQLPAVDPALANPTRLWTSEASQHLYLLEPETQRVVVFDKDGRLVNQYQSGSWTNLRDLAVDESNRLLYVISGTTLYRTPLTGG